MKIGIISDTHDNLPKIKNAVELLNQHQPDLVIHAGDYVSAFSLDPYSALNCEWTGVFGNNDGDHAALAKKSRGRIKPGPLLISPEGRKIAVMHEFAACSEADIIICGHTHLPRIEHCSGQLILNPGEVSGWLYGRSSLIILDLSSLTPELIKF